MGVARSRPPTSSVLKQKRSGAMPRPGLFRRGAVWLKLVTRQWLGVSVLLTALIAVAIVLTMLR